MSEKMTREDVVRIARAARLAEPPRPFNPFNPWGASDEALARFAHKVIEHFLATTGQYVTNDASREAAIQAAVEAERSETAQLLRVDAGYVFEDECSGARDAVNYCVSLVEARRGN